MKTNKQRCKRKEKSGKDNQQAGPEWKQKGKEVAMYRKVNEAISWVG